MHNKYEETDAYEYKMIEAFIDKPEVTSWYVQAFKKFTVHGVDVMRWHWSWWAFFGNIFYLLYRKSYLAAGILFLLTLVTGVIPFGGLILWILTGGYAPYFVYKTYKEKRLEVESMIEDESKRIETMRLVGGYNDWAIWVAVVIHIFIWIAFFSMIGFMLTMLGLAVAGNAIQ
jgi:hypothetical protein